MNKTRSSQTNRCFKMTLPPSQPPSRPTCKELVCKSYVVAPNFARRVAEPKECCHATPTHPSLPPSLRPFHPPSRPTRKVLVCKSYVFTPNFARRVAEPRECCQARRRRWFLRSYQVLKAWEGGREGGRG